MGSGADDGPSSAGPGSAGSSADDSGDSASGASDDGSGDGASGDADASDDAASASDGGVPTEPTFAEDVAPILAEHCWSCHIPGGIAPFPMLEYDDVVALAEVIVPTTQARVMPPWPLDATGACGSFLDERWLEDDEVATFAAWLDAGTPAGDLSLVPEPPAPPSLDDVSATVTIQAYTPEGSPPENPLDDYRCFLVAPPSTGDTVLTAYEVHPGVQAEVHHIGIFSLHSDAAEAAAVAKSGQDGRPGYTCFGDAGVPDAAILAGWAPGVPVVRYPEGTGTYVPGGRAMIVQVHYNLASGASQDATSVDFQFDPTATPLRSVIMIDTSLAIPPGVTDHVEGESTSFGGSDTVVVAAFPHMHTIGKSLRVDVDDGSCAINVPRWDFHWQQIYSYAAPVVVPGGSQVTLSCTYDSTGRSETTYFGEGTSDEMCAIQFLAMP